MFGVGVLKLSNSVLAIRSTFVIRNKVKVVSFTVPFLLGTKLQWSGAIGLAIFIWLFTAFWAAMPLIGWGEYDYEPLRTCCTLDYSKGDR